MKLLRGFLWLLVFQLFGHAIVELLSLPVSHALAGLLLLLTWLLARRRLNESVATASQALIPLLAMLIMPGVVGVFFVIDEFAGHWTAIMLALVVGTFLSVLTTLWLMRRFMPREATDSDTRGRQG
ncbi:CidA/LrgA family protein [Halomonas sp. MCCC 1A17488]|uniref:CidA/LrgA family protein n=1 Tax=Billgrantia sulfidoxydans TaxID=2733484 RepID=A0ABX7W3D0_9GAMM|nr:MULTISPECIES: CidA/LrgA family protein [Halomonas]MCE8016163.1 CidA/LrgA family protein [Halomonas sp. MCCC 1A17488]MCG3239496.1 CidA/LrgA family protein [Halomonas sp. MCCC 1A17488]QPP50581.1 CidA/LrgA family protein [Halomonas sp. SS10-MC5]QTP54167.1 CidA/LrgA family protein [Halomonas sulfidoxydans]